ncbi:oxygen-dependent protoporphyrinogen oxidase [Jatrophihabitans sp. GAS493]|uniref:protoporphyrinogen oxidase n=1 Tax=Jatrophihabitans sp. GAS493 TaxID=1907575 RepID=UPI000BB8F0DE|nr:protoporphyrinogen oxidase [Jatrophihabitans sp. GAS493]SOD74069.1 oxygen-dependent protoporphyrinogen oxidase [Jatrophihabitans sp. GAS493]
MRVVIIGGGISGLAAAWRVRQVQPEAEIVVLESSREVGGKLRSGEVAGVRVDLGAESLLARNPLGVGLVGELGLAEELITPQTLSAGIRAGGQTHGIPAGTLLGIPTGVDSARASGLFSDASLRRIAEETDQDPMPPLARDLAVGTLVRQRLDDEVVERLVEPLLGGVYAGKADGISVAAAMPALYARLQRDGGSLVSAAAATVATGRAAAGDGPVFVSLPGGLGRLPQSLAASRAFTVRTGVTVRGLRRLGPDGFELQCGATISPERIMADKVIVATPAGKAAALLREVAPVAARELAAIETSSVAIVTLAYRAEALRSGAGLPAGSGLLIAPGEGFSVKATTFTSQKWPGTPPDLVVLRASLGRAGETVVLQRDDAELTRLVRSDLARLTGLTAAPVDALVTRWAGGLPQYAVGHPERIERIRGALADVAGLAACGATYEGVGIPACIASAHRAVAQLGLESIDRGE